MFTFNHVPLSVLQLKLGQRTDRIRTFINGKRETCTFNVLGKKLI